MRRGHRRASADGTDDGARPRGSAKDRGLRLLAVRWRSRAELESRLRRAGFEPDEVATALEDLERAGLIDDARFARALVADRAGVRLAGDRVIRMALRQKGVADLLADEALAEVTGEDERALSLARRRAPRLSALEPNEAYRRLYGLLVRRGFGPSAARDACRTALAETAEVPEGAEELSEP